MLFAVRMNVTSRATWIPRPRLNCSPRKRRIPRIFSARANGKNIWRCVGEYANLSIFDVNGNERLHEILWGLPLFPYMTIDITPLAAHPSDITL